MDQASLDDLLIPTAKAAIYWCAPHEHDERRFTIAVLPIAGRPGESPVYDRIGDDADNFPNSGGACFAEWPDRITPEHAFAAIAAELGSLPAEEHRAAFWELVRQFARIEGCGWARLMHEQRENRPLTREDLEPFALLPDGRRLPVG